MMEIIPPGYEQKKLRPISTSEPNVHYKMGKINFSGSGFRIPFNDVLDARYLHPRTLKNILQLQTQFNITWETVYFFWAPRGMWSILVIGKDVDGDVIQYNRREHHSIIGQTKLHCNGNTGVRIVFVLHNNFPYALWKRRSKQPRRKLKCFRLMFRDFTTWRIADVRAPNKESVIEEYLWLKNYCTYQTESDFKKSNTYHVLDWVKINWKTHTAWARRRLHENFVINPWR